MTNADDLITPLINTSTEVGHYAGLTKREYFAAMAMQGFLANDRFCNYFERMASDSAIAADSLIEALNNNTLKTN